MKLQCSTVLGALAPRLDQIRSAHPLGAPLDQLLEPLGAPLDQLLCDFGAPVGLGLHAATACVACVHVQPLSGPGTFTKLIFRQGMIQITGQRHN